MFRKILRAIAEWPVTGERMGYRYTARFLMRHFDVPRKAFSRQDWLD